MSKNKCIWFEKLADLLRLATLWKSASWNVKAIFTNIKITDIIAFGADPFYMPHFEVHVSPKPDLSPHTLRLRQSYGFVILYHATRDESTARFTCPLSLLSVMQPSLLLLCCYCQGTYKLWPVKFSGRFNIRNRIHIWLAWNSADLQTSWATINFSRKFLVQGINLYETIGIASTDIKPLMLCFQTEISS
jgi:hypothetical protein